jgi:LPS sulfotransferase NodH
MTSPFILYCQPRTGSTTLARILNCHPEVNCYLEPFNPDNSGGYLARVRDVSSLRVTLNEIWRTHNGIKHVAGYRHWPFTERDLILDMLGRYPDHTVIFMTRRNLLRRLLSEEIAYQTRSWHPWDDASRNALPDCEFGPADLKRIRRGFAVQHAYLTACRHHLESHGVSYRDLTYEDWLGPDVSRDQQYALIDQLLELLGFCALTPAIRHTEAARLLDAVTTGSDSASVYRRIPNIDEIEAEFGSDETGWLFRETAQSLPRAWDRQAR